MRKPAPVQQHISDEDDILTVRMTLAFGRFESSISIPLFSSQDEKERFVNSWLDLMAAGLKCGEKRRARP